MRSLPLALILAITAASLLPTGAMAARTTRVVEGSIGAFNPERQPTAIAVDQSNGDVYAIDDVSHGVYRFDSTGAPKNFTAGPDAGTNTLTGFLTDLPPGSIEQHGPSSIAIDNSGGPLDGTIYVSEGSPYSKDVVKVFDRSGASLGFLDGSATQNPFEEFEPQFFRPCVAVDQSDGSLYVANSETLSSVWRYAPASPTGPISDADFAVTGVEGIDSACGLAADDGNVYSVSRGFDLERKLRRFSASDFSPTPKKASSTVLDTGVTYVSLDPQTGEVYADEGYRVAVLSSAGQLLYRFGRIADIGVASQAVAVRSAASGPAAKAYVADSGNGRIAVFGSLAQVPTYTHAEVAAFGEDGTGATTFASDSSPWGAAFEQASGKLYTTERNVGIFGFDASSPPSFSPLAGFDPLSAPDPPSEPNLAVDNTALPSAGNVYLTSANTDLIYGFTASGVPLGGAFPIDPAVTPGAPEGSPKEPSGVAVDSAGNIWVSNLPAKRILEYSSAGAFQGSIDTSANGSPGNLAFASNDDLYVDVVGKMIWKYTASSGYTTATSIAKTPRAGYVAGMAVNPSDDHLHIAYDASSDGGVGQGDEIAWVEEFDPTGNFIDEFVVGLAGSSAPVGLAVDGATGGLYVADVKQHKLRAFGSRVLLPEVSTAPASDFANSSVTLNGAISTQGVALTDCHFEYVSESAFRAGGFADLSSGGSAPCAPAAGSIPLDLDSHPVSATASGLVKNTEYSFRLSATNAQGSSLSDVGRFSTAAQPGVETVGAPVRSATTAVLNGRVNPRNAATEYHFEYGTQGPCDSNPCQSSPVRAAGSGAEIELVSEQVDGLQPGTTYHYRLVAENGNVDGPAAGADMVVITRASDSPLSHGHFPGPPGSDRAYEQVSLPESGGNPINTVGSVGEVESTDGNRVMYELAGGAPITESGNGFGNVLFAERPAGEHPSEGWKSRLITPARSAVVGNPSPFWETASTPDLTTAVGAATNNFSDAFSFWSLPASSAASQLFNGSSDQRKAATYGISADGSRTIVGVIGGTTDPAYPTAGAAVNLFDVSSGTPHLVSVMPDGSPACVEPTGLGSHMPSSQAPWISPDGSRVFFGSQGTSTSCAGPYGVYLRNIDTGETTSVSGTPLSGAACDSILIRTIADAAFYWTTSRMAVDDSPATSCGESNGDVYRYDLGERTRECVTCVAPGLDANVMVSLSGSGSAVGIEGAIGVSRNGSRVYLQTQTQLLPGAPDGEAAIYRVDVGSGDLALVAPARGVQSGTLSLGKMSSRTGGYGVSADGSVLTFRSGDPRLNPIGGSQNGGTAQAYRYDDRDRSLICISCPTDGSAPVAGLKGDPLMSADGETISFVTPSALVNADQNRPAAGSDPRIGDDAYEWRDGRPLLVTDGLTSWPSKGEGFEPETPRLGGIDADGRDLLFSAPVQYTPDALDGYRRLYDARIGGGIDFSPPPPPCPLEVCQGIPQGAPEERRPGTADFHGPGNLSEGQGRAGRCAKGKHRVKRKGKSRCLSSHRQRPSKHQQKRRTHR